MRVDALLDAAEQAFATRGYSATTMTEVAAGAGAPIGSLYQFFPSKEAVALGVLERSFGALFNALDALNGGRRDPVSLADALADLMMRMATGRAAGMALLAEGPVAQRGARAEIRAGLRRRIAALLCDASPSLDPARAEQVAVMVLQMSKTIILAPGQTEEVPGLGEAFRTLLRAALQVWLA